MPAFPIVTRCVIRLGILLKSEEPMNIFSRILSRRSRRQQREERIRQLETDAQKQILGEQPNQSYSIDMTTIACSGTFIYDDDKSFNSWTSHSSSR